MHADFGVPTWPLARRFLGVLQGQLVRLAKVTPFVLPFGILVVWQTASHFDWVEPILLPSPIYVVETIWLLLSNGELLKDVAASTSRVLQGFFIAAALGLSLGIVIGLFRPAARLADLLIQVLKPIPPIAWIPLSILWFGIDEGAKIFIILVGAFYPILTSTIDALRQTDARYVELARVLEVPRHRFIREIMLPGALPHIMSGLRLGVTISWMCVVGAELIAAPNGVGFLIMDGRAMSRADIVLTGMLTMGVLGKLTDDSLRWAESRLVRWRTQFAGL
jgi:sulfonate transport system permease protein